MGTVYRYSADARESMEFVDGLPNFFHVAKLDTFPRVQLDKGIAPIGKVPKSSGIDTRTPAILISSTVHNKGSELNPWQDQIEPDQGFAMYFGDSKQSGNPGLAPGNKLLLNEYARHTSGDPAERALATPLLVFQGVQVSGRAKGNKKFAGLAVIERVELVTQYNPKIGYFTNYIFKFGILSLTKEDENLDWRWINDRRNPELALDATLEFAPSSWKKWVKNGNGSLDTLRRRVSTLRLDDAASQLPKIGSAEAKALEVIYNYYSITSRKHRFELLASRVVMDFVHETGAIYKYGWFTKASGDGGVDFVGKIELGQGFSQVPIIVLGQAKCEDPSRPTNGKDIARTVARLKRGWIGAYVTTSFFSKNVQSEIIEDQYPLIKINIQELARHAIRLKDSSGANSLLDYLKQIDVEYEGNTEQRRPEDILWI
jgi:hypothetical protein